jgi:hypothetical protein
LLWKRGLVAWLCVRWAGLSALEFSPGCAPGALPQAGVRRAFGAFLRRTRLWLATVSAAWLATASVALSATASVVLLRLRGLI